MTQVSWSQPSRARQLSPPFDECRILTVRARMQQGAVLDEQWPATLDGIVASVARRRRLGPVYGIEIDHHVDPLPIARWHRGANKQWHWQATCARPAGHSERELHWWHNRFRHARAERIVPNLPPIVRPSMGRYRAYRSPLSVTVCAALEWRVVGQEAGLRDLLADVVAIGKKHATGEGRVLSWEVVDEGPPDHEWALWWDGLIARPVTARLAPLVAPHAEITRAVIRPPYFQGRRLRDVLAPWTTREEVDRMRKREGEPG